MEWKPVPGWTMYEVSEAGDVRNVRTGRVLRPGRMSRAGHVGVVLAGGVSWGYSGRRKSLSIAVHVIVCEAFHGPKPTPKHEVGHRDGVATNNHSTNLRWVTRQENMDDMAIHGTRPQTHGESNPNVKLSKEKVLEIMALRGVMTGRQVAAHYGISESMPKHIWRGRYWRSITGLPEPSKKPPR